LEENMPRPIGLCKFCGDGKVYFEKKTERYVCNKCKKVIAESYEDVIELGGECDSSHK